MPGLLLGAAGSAHGDALPFPGAGYVSVGGPALPGQLVDITVKERPGNPHPTEVEVSSRALTDDTTLGDTGQAWVGAARIKERAEPGTYEVKFTLRHKDANCMAEADRDYLCDYPPIVLRQQLKVAAPPQEEQEGLGFGPGLAIGVPSGVAATVAAGAVWLRRKRRRAVDEPA
ncbi:hypothetical protein ACFYO9_18420 [Streptomyces sp. NPDC005863]|uniref:hypothetical protein n=1 Tax=unclassified Streptomyces TaxID=2593676 RepID=UPI0033E7DA5E